MEGEWQQLIQSVFFGLVFSYLLAKVISFVISFRDENLSLTRDSNPESREGATAADDDSAGSQKSGGSDGEGSVQAEKGSVSSGDLLDDDDDWEGVESTELDEEFSAATAFVAATAADRLSQKVSNDVQLQLYGFYKIATEGPCSGPQPSALKMTARAKWQAWQKLGAMPPEEAMQKYIAIVTELYPTWASGSTNKNKDEGDSSAPSGDSKGPMGPVFSTFVHEEESGTDLKMDAIHAFAREGEVDDLLKCIDNGVSVNLKDSEGRTPLHWAVDRGHLNLVELLLNHGADVNAKDIEGLTPLHYAVVCEREAIAEFLVKHNADTNAKDNDGASPFELCESNWPWMQGTAKQA